MSKMLGILRNYVLDNKEHDEQCQSCGGSCVLWIIGTPGGNLLLWHPSLYILFVYICMCK